MSMPEQSAAKLDGVHPRMLRGNSEASPQELGKRVIGQAIERAIELAGLTKQDVAFRMGYTDSGVMGRWISGTETPQLWKLWAVEELRVPLVIALARLSDRIEISTTLRMVG